MKKKNQSITKLDWWKNKSISNGLPKGHPFLDRENDKRIGKKVLKENADIIPDPSDNKDEI